MKALPLVVFVLALIGTGTLVVSIMGSGPCTPPPCTEADLWKPCQQSCNGPDSYQCIPDGEGGYKCGNPEGCNALVHCDPAPPCFITECTRTLQCCDAATYVCDGDVCCKTTPAEVGADCELENGDPGTCNEAHECVP